METKYTAIVRKSRLEYVAVCLEIIVSAMDVPQILRRKEHRHGVTEL